MRRILALSILLLPVPAAAQTTVIHDSVKPIIEADPTYLERSIVRVILTNGYVPNAADSFATAQQFEITDDGLTPAATRHGYYPAGFGSPGRMILTNGDVTAGVYKATVAAWPRLTQTSFDGWVAFVEDETCSPTSVCRAGTTHQIVASGSLSFTRLVTNQPLLFQWSGATATVFTGTVINHSDVDPDNWTAPAPTVITPTMNTILVEDCLNCTIETLRRADTGELLKPFIVNGTPTTWNHFQAENADQVILSTFVPPSNLRYCQFDNLHLDAVQNPGDTLGTVDFKNMSFCGFINSRFESDLREDRGDMQFGYKTLEAAVFLTDGVPHTAEDDPITSGPSWSGLGGGMRHSYPTSIATFLINVTVSGFYNAPTFMGESHFSYDTLYRGFYNGGGYYGAENSVHYRSGSCGSPNHNTELVALPARKMTFQHYDSLVSCGTQDWVTGDSKLSINGAEAVYIIKSCFSNPVNAPLVDTNTLRLNRIRRRIVVIDSCFATTKDMRFIGRIHPDLVAQGRVLIEYDTFKWWNDNFTTPIGVWRPVGAYSQPSAPVAEWLDLTDPAGVNAKICVQFTATGSHPQYTGGGSAARLDNAFMLRKDGDILTAEHGTLTTTLATGPCNTTGTILGAKTASAYTVSRSSSGTFFAMAALEIPEAMTPGAQYHYTIEADQAYGDVYLAAQGANIPRIRAVAGVAGSGDSDTWVQNGTTGVWSASPANIMFVIGDDKEDLYTPAAWFALTGQGNPAGASANVIADPLLENAPAYPTNVYTCLNGTQSACAGNPGLPNPGNLANQWGRNFVATTLGTMRSWFQPATGSPLIGTASDSTNRGITGGDSEPSDPEPPANLPPTADAGEDLVIESGGTFVLNGLVGDTTPTGTLTAAWTQTGGTCTGVTFGNAAAQNTTATAAIDDCTATFRLTASDGEFTAFDEASGTINAVPMETNAAPVVDVGLDQIVRLGSDLALSPGVTEDGLDEPYTSWWCVTQMPSSVRGWRVPGCIPYVRNSQGNGISSSTMYVIKQEAGITPSAIFDLRSSVDPVNTHMWVFKNVGGSGTFAFVGRASTPRATGQGVPAVQQAGPTVAVVPPSMAVCDAARKCLIKLSGQYRSSAVTITAVAGDGQTWECGTNLQNPGNALTTRECWGIFDGTWDANPSMTVGAGTEAMSVRLQVWDPAGGTVTVDVAEATTTAAGSDPLVVAAPATVTEGALVTVLAADQDDNRWNPTPPFMPYFPGSSDLANTSLRFPAIGTYQACMTAIDGDLAGTGEQDQDCLKVTVLPRNKTPKFRLGR